ncbi:MAG: phosphopentomutase [Gammaproteobacteria bacterium]|nr:MAG: phosphopentomutase [Gammaproteobacteria bacterium]
MSRTIILVLDSLGIGDAEDADKYGDRGSNTLGHIWEAAIKGEADRDGLRKGPLRTPNLERLGLLNALVASSSQPISGLEANPHAEGAWGYARERSYGKDTPSGHWEIAGLPVEFEWGFFPPGPPSFPEELVNALIERCKLPGILGNCHASGTEIIQRYGEEHIRTGKPICYTSADSVFQIAAHEEHFGMDRLYEVCEVARELVDQWKVGRVIARPFVGETRETFQRTGNRRDYTTPPHAPTLLDIAVENGREVISVGKIADIFAHKGITRKIKANGNMALFDATLAAMEEAPEGSIVFTNFVDFDMQYGHRRDVPGYAHALEAFDQRLPELEARLQPGDLVLITADHGCDPTWTGTDHTREHVPVVFFGPDTPAAALGERQTFADMGQTVAKWLGLPPLGHGEACF